MVVPWPWTWLGPDGAGTGRCCLHGNSMPPEEAGPTPEIVLTVDTWYPHHASSTSRTVFLPGWALSTPVRVPGRRPRPVRPATGRRCPRLAQPGQRMQDSPQTLPLGTYRSATSSREVHGRWREVRSGGAGAGTGAVPEVHDEGACGFWSDEATCRGPQSLARPGTNGNEN